MTTFFLITNSQIEKVNQKSFLLFPFKYFQPPKVNIHFSYFTLPTGNWVIVFLSFIFLICCSGCFYVFLTNSPMEGYTLTASRDLIVSIFDLERFESQFGIETYYVIVLYSLILLSLISLYFLMVNPPNNKFFYYLLAFFAFLFPFLLFLLIPLLQYKDYNYFPGFFMNLKHKIPQF